MTETFEQMALRIAIDAQIDHARKHGLQHAGSGLDEDTAEFIILFASNIRDELEKRAEQVAWMNSRNGFIAKENKNPEYNVGLYSFPPSAAARIAELEKQRDALLGDVERCYRMLLSDPDTKGALFKAENILREAIAQANEVAA